MIRRENKEFIVKKTSSIFKESFSKKTLLKAFLIFIFLFLILLNILIQFEAFENIYEFSRNHEDWELDELILGIFAFLISISSALFFLSFSFGKKVIEQTKKEIEQQKRIQTNQKLQSMGSMLSGLTHSLNNHLVPIITLSKIIKEDTPKRISNK